MAIVLLVPAAAGLDLAAAGQGLLLASELFQGVAADKVKTASDLAFQPVVERGIGLEHELAKNRGGRRLDIGRPMGKHAEIHQSLAQMRAIHPLGHAGIVRIGHEQ